MEAALSLTLCNIASFQPDPMGIPASSKRTPLLGDLLPTAFFMFFAS
jgi:hypothetical protein